MPYIQRLAENQLREALEDTPAVVIAGPRQSGKSTLAQHIADDSWSYLTLDDDNILNAARNDPQGLLKRQKNSVIIDEVQRAPGLLKAVKLLIDQDRRPGRFLITGSADILSMPRTSESLAGRSEIIPLMPLSQVELHKRQPEFIAAAFKGDIPTPDSALEEEELIAIILKGGFPEVIARNNVRRQQQWCQAYLAAIVQRDIHDITDIKKAHELPQLLAILAAYSSQLINQQAIGQKIGLNGKTINNYISALEQLFLVHRLPAWHSNALKRLVKKPKLHFSDSALLASIIEANPAAIEKNRKILGPLLETFIFTELQKQVSWQENHITLSHYRDKDQVEVDFILENSRSEIVGIEVKAASTVHAKDFKGLQKLANITENKFCLGIVLYAGDQVLSFGDRQLAVPINCLWSVSL